jgi:GNAT superfamily N-acetyltransferase
MSDDNLSRMIRLADEFFETRNDPAQISVTEDVMEQLRKIHPSTLTEENDGRGPIAWIMVIPTTHKIMEHFIAGKISERGVLESTPLNVPYDMIYLCSALVLPEHRGRGIAKRLVINAISSIRKDHPVRELFYWAFSVEGQKLAESVARSVGLPLRERVDTK